MKRNPASPSKTKRPRTPAQRAATARMLAANKARRGLKSNPKRKAVFKNSVPIQQLRRKQQRAVHVRARAIARPGQYKVCAWTQNGLRSHIATFADKAKAFEYARAYNKAHKIRVTVET